MTARANERLLNELLPVLDDLERALEAAASHEEAKLEEGVELVHRSLASLLERHGLSEIEAEGAFDPHVHEALLSQPGEGAESGTVLQVHPEGLPPRRSRAPADPGDRERMSNPYDTLGVAKNASADEIKKAYRKLARESHPDASGGDEARFKEIQGAYDVLSDPEKRKAYDTFGSTNGRPGPEGFGGAQFQDFDLSDLFGGLFGGGAGRGGGARRGPQPERGADLQTEVHISFEDALAGVQVPVRANVETACHTCGGSGAEPGTAPIVCPVCSGRGITSDSHGLFSLSQPCPRCRGNGTIVEKPCKTCRGSGRERVQKTYQVKIPAGAKDGTRIRLKGRGEQGRAGGPTGDLYVVVRVAASPLYERRGDDLVVEVPVSYPDAALGAKIEVATPDGPISLKVPAGSQPGKLLKVKGRGAPRLKGSGKGDLLARLRLTVPEKLSKAEKQALEELRKVTG